MKFLNVSEKSLGKAKLFQRKTIFILSLIIILFFLVSCSEEQTQDTQELTQLPQISGDVRYQDTIIDEETGEEIEITRVTRVMPGRYVEDEPETYGDVCKCELNGATVVTCDPYISDSFDPNSITLDVGMIIATSKSADGKTQSVTCSISKTFCPAKPKPCVGSECEKVCKTQLSTELSNCADQIMNTAGSNCKSTSGPFADQGACADECNA
ncbi:hypothetical protein ACFLZB_02625 [Nanoarchaeota archaeon]